MKVRSILVFLSILLALTFSGCGDQSDFVATTTSGLDTPVRQPGTGGGDVPTGNPAELPTIPARVVLPTGSTLDFTNNLLTSQLTDFPVAQDGESTIVLEGQGRVFVFLTDSNDRPILIGFLTDTSTELSVRTTVEATIFFGMNLQAQPEELQDLFWQNIQSFPDYQTTVEQAEDLFRNDPNFFESTAYQDYIRDYVNFLSNSGIAPRLELRDNNVRSGLILEEQPGDRVRVINGLRRRCHAFRYKKSFVNQADQEVVLHTDIVADNPNSQEDTGVGPTEVFDSFLGTLQGAAAGNGLKFFRSESALLNTSLGPGEKEAVFSIRVIGPSASPGRLSAKEQAKLRELEIETLALDVVLPLLFKMASQESFLKDLKADPDLESIIDTTIGTLKTLPGITEALDKQQYELAIDKIQEGLVTGQLNESFEPIFNKVAALIAKNRGLSGESLEAFTKKIGRINKLFEITDDILEANNYRRLVASWFETSKLEEFEVISTQGKVTLAPSAGIAIQGEVETFKAIVQDANLSDGEVFSYLWSTSGQYGELRDGLGKSGMSFTTSQSEVEFVPVVSQLPEGVQLIDIIHVEVSTEQGNITTRVGEKAGTVEVRELGFEITPKNSEIKGRDSLTLSVRDTEGKNPLDSSFFEYKFVWETQGVFGFFDATTTSFTSETSNQVVYTALEEEDDGIEEVTARVYCRPKDSTEPYKFVNRVSVSIQITNDPNLQFLFVPVQIEVRDIPDFGGPGVTGESILHYFEIPQVPGAINYSLEIVEWSWVGTQFHLGDTRFWEADDPTLLHSSGSFRYYVHGGSQGVDAGSNLMGFYQSAIGLAKITITLEP